MIQPTLVVEELHQ